MSALPEWRRARFGRGVRRPDGAGSVSVVLTIDTTPFVEAMARASAGMATMRRDFDHLARELRHRQQLAQAGIAARWYVRGGLDPAYADPAARDAEVRRLVRSFGTPGVDVHQVAASFLRGWIEHRSEVAA